DSVTVAILRGQGLDVAALREEVLYLLGLPGRGTVPPSSGYERFTDRARKAMQLANQAAQRFNHEYIGTEHILLGLVEEGSTVPAAIMRELARLTATDPLTPYRRRAFRLLCSLRLRATTSLADRLAELGVLAERLAALCADVQAAGLDGAEALPLR